MAIQIKTGPAIVGHLFATESEAIAKAIPVLVGEYAERTGLDVHHAEALVVHCESRGRRWTEVRVAGSIVGSWAAVDAS